MNSKILIHKDAFIGLFASAYGTLKIESSGFLAGEKIKKRTRDEFVAEVAQATQKSKRTYKTVTPNEKEDKRLEFALNGSIGGFHSHFNAANAMSNEDINFIRTYYPKGIEVLVSLEEVSVLKRLKITPISIVGCFVDNGNQYKAKFHAYYLDFGKDGKKGALRRAEIVIPKKVLRNYF